MNMKLIIRRTEPFTTIQAAFHQHFHYLKIEAYAKSHEMHELNPEKQHLSADTLLSAISTFKKEGEFVIDGEMPTGEFEKALWNEFGIAVQVSRRSGHLWIQTAFTDDWSLNKQNEESRLMNQADSGDDVSNYLDTKDQED